MKTKLLNFRVLAIMMACLTCALSASAYDFYTGGIYYTKLASNNVEVAYKTYNVADYSGSVTVPSTVTYNGVTYTVKGIGYCAFGECTNLTSISLPSTLTYVGDLAFIRCRSLSTVVIPTGVTWVGNNAFYACDNLTTVYLPNTLTMIDYAAFSNCDLLESITIPASVDSIGNSAFGQCPNLTQVTSLSPTPPRIGSVAPFWHTTYENGTLKVPNAYAKNLYSAHPVWGQFTNITSTVYYDFSNNGLYYCKNGSNTVAVVAKNDNYNSYTGSITVPAGVANGNASYTVTEIANNAFRNCSGLTSVSIPNTITRIGEFAFGNCPNMTTFTQRGVESSVLTEIGNNAFAGCTSLSSFTFPETLQKIGNYAFSNCKGITTVTIPDNVTTIGAGAFYICSNLETLNIGTGCTSIGEWACMECTSLAYVNCRALTPPTIYNYTFRNNDGFSTAQLRVPYSSKAAYQQAEYWRLFTNIISYGYDFKVDGVFYRYNENDPSTVGVSYEYPIFNSYSGVVTIPDQVTYQGTTYNVTSIIGSAFRNCTDLTYVNIGNNVKLIGFSAFYNCSSLTSIVIPPSVDSIANHAFNGCTGLTSVIANSLTKWCQIGFGNGQANPLIYAGHLYSGNEVTYLNFPSTVTKVKDFAFYNCRGLTSISIPNNVTEIGACAFQFCENVTSLYIGEGMTKIGNVAFNGCTSLTTLRCRAATPPTISSDSFNSCYNTATLRVPNSCLSAYQNATYWKNFTSIIGEYDFKVNNIYYLITGSNTVSVTYYNKSVGTDYTGNVVIPSTVTKNGVTYTVTAIGDYAFSRCPVTSVTLPNSITSIERNAFQNCTSLTSITIPDNVTKISLQAFEGCTALSEVNLGNGLLTIGPWAFMSCTSLTSFEIPASVTTIGGSAFNGCSALTSVTCWATTPPTITSYTFDPNHYSNATLAVLPSAITAYQNDENWGNFVSIQSARNYDFMVDGIYYVVTDQNCVSVTRKDSNGHTYSGEVIIPETVTYDGVTYTVTRIGANAFTQCPDLTSLTLPATIVTLYYGFYNNMATGLTTITCLAIEPPYGMTQMTAEQYAGVTVIVPKNSVAAYQADNGWGQYATITGMTYDFERDGFYYEISDENEVMVTRGNSTSSTYGGEVTIPENVSLAGTSYTVTAVGYQAFYQCTGLTKINLPSTVTSIGNYAFYKCTGLTSVNLGNVTSIGSYSFDYCSSLATAKLNGALESIQGTSFLNCTALKSFSMYLTEELPWLKYEIINGVIYTRKATDKTLVSYPCGKTASIFIVPDGVVNIGDYAFFANAYVETVNMPTSLREIKKYGFSKCTNIENLEVPKGVTTIGNYAFAGCTALKSAFLPSTLTSLGGAAFHDDTALITVGVKAQTPPVCQTVGTRPTLAPFDEDHFSTVLLGVPTGCKSTYKAANIWKLFSTIREYDSLVDVDIILGDVNGDQIVDISDVTDLISHVLGNSPAGFVIEAANMNGDSTIDIGDVTAIIAKVLGTN
jgi:hypothetical protein